MTEEVEAKPIDKDEEEALIEQAKNEMPVTKDDINPDVHPMAKGIRSAKACINEILKDADNLKKLKMALQTMFDQNPIEFLMQFEDLMDKYDKIEESKNDGKQSVRLYLRQDNGSESAVEITREE